MIRAARRGKRVVRLKCGDPFVFGRGGEEALALRAAGIPFEVVPGVSSAVAAPALAGIPGDAPRPRVRLHRRLRPRRGGLAARARRHRAARRCTVVVLMGLAARGDVARPPARARLAGDTPAGDPARGRSTPRAPHLDRDRSRTLAGVDVPAGLEDAPGTIVIGDVGRPRSDRAGARASAEPRNGGRSCMLSTLRPTTLGRTRLSFADEAEIDEFVRDARRLRARRADARPVAGLPPGARHVRPAPDGRRADAARQDPAGHPRRRRSSRRSPTSPSATRAASATSPRARTSSSTS